MFCNTDVQQIACGATVPAPRFRLHGLTLHGSRTDGYGINGTAQYVRYFSIRDFGGALPLSTP